MVKKMSLAIVVAVSMLMVQTVVPMGDEVYSQLAAKFQKDFDAPRQFLRYGWAPFNVLSPRMYGDSILELVNPSEEGYTVLATFAKWGYSPEDMKEVIRHIEEYKVLAAKNPQLAEYVNSRLYYKNDFDRSLKATPYEIAGIDPENGDPTLLHIAARGSSPDARHVGRTLQILLEQPWFTAEDAREHNKQGKTPLDILNENTSWYDTEEKKRAKEDLEVIVEFG